MSGSTASPRIGFIGAGQMATALARGLIGAGVVPAGNVLAADVAPEAGERFAAATGAQTAASNAAVWEGADVVFLAVKPQHVHDALADAAERAGPRHLVVSIAAGVTLSSLTASLGESSRVVRVMPNTPCLVGEAASAFALGGAATEEDARLVETLLSTVGTALRVPERLLDAVTGLSGSGPAYVYLVVEALSDGGVRMGLPRDVAAQLAAQTVLGAAKMVLETGQHPGVLKDAVASPGGTTIAGLHVLERGGLRGLLIDAVEAATLRSRALGQSAVSG